MFSLSSFFKYAKIFKTNLNKGAPIKVISDPVAVEVFKESRVYTIPMSKASIYPSWKNAELMNDTSMVLNKDEENYYISIIARTKESNPVIAKRFCEYEIDKIIVMLSVIYTPDLFENLIYNGWLLENDKGIGDMWVKMVNMIDVNGDNISKQFSSITKFQKEDPDLLKRFTLMSRFFYKSLLEKPGEEKFLWLWTIMEVYPMKDTTNIKPISELIANLTGHTSEYVKEKLSIGKLFGIRSNLVHNGYFDIDIKELGETITKLENIVTEILRYMCGYKYSGALDTYLK